MEASTAVKPSTFISKSPNLKLFVRSDDPERDGMPTNLYDATGRKYGQTPERIIHFENNQFEADEQAARRLGMELKDLLTFLRTHEMFGAGLYEDYMPEEQEPTVKAQISDIMAAAARQDADAVQEIKDGERKLHNRPEVLQAATAALEQLAALE